MSYKRWLVFLSVLLGVAALPLPAEAAPATQGEVTIELEFAGEVDQWGAVLGPSGGDCEQTDSELGAFVVCVVGLADGALQFSVRPGVVVTGACGDAEPMRILDSDRVVYTLDEDLRATCRVEIAEQQSLGLIIGVFSDVVLAGDERLNEMLLTDTDTVSADAPPINVLQDCALVDNEPVQERPEVIIGSQYDCSLPGASYVLQLGTLTPGANHTIQCGDETAPRVLDADGAVIDNGGFCRIEIRDIDGPLAVSVAGTAADFEPIGWSAFVYKNGSRVGYVFNEAAGDFQLGRCESDGRCVASGVAAGSYELVVDGPPGSLLVSIDGGAPVLVVDRIVAFDMSPGVERSIELLVSNELPATGSDRSTGLFAVIAALLLAAGALLGTAARRGANA